MGARPKKQLMKCLLLTLAIDLQGRIHAQPATMLACQYDGSPPTITSPPQTANPTIEGALQVGAESSPRYHFSGLRFSCSP